MSAEEGVVGGRDERRPGGERDSLCRVVERLRKLLSVGIMLGSALSVLESNGGERGREVRRPGGDRDSDFMDERRLPRSSSRRSEAEADVAVVAIVVVDAGVGVVVDITVVVNVMVVADICVYEPAVWKVLLSALDVSVSASVTGLLRRNFPDSIGREATKAVVDVAKVPPGIAEEEEEGEGVVAKAERVRRPKALIRREDVGNSSGSNCLSKLESPASSAFSRASFSGSSSLLLSLSLSLLLLCLDTWLALWEDTWGVEGT